MSKLLFPRPKGSPYGILSSIGPVVSEKMFENVDRWTDAGVIGILIAHLGAFGSGELIKDITVQA